AEAVRFATLRGGRSGRTAWQFAAHYVGRKRLHERGE
ncbi:MAG TPA: AAA family ATPase, partial [Halomonas sp.]|nr:AAA family ATPase [Halomonas sp.]